MVTQKAMGRGQLVERLTAQVGSKAMAIALLKKRGQMDADGNLTQKGRARNNMTAAERAIDRVSKANKIKDKSRYKYNPKTNRATLKNGK